MMDWVSQTIASFGQLAGFPRLALDDEGRAGFIVEPDGLLLLHDLRPSGGSDMLVTLCNPLGADPAAGVRRALVLADFRSGAEWPMQLSIRARKLAVTVRMPCHSFMMSSLEQAVQSLFDFHARVAQSG